LLAFTAGFVDTTGFIALFGLFTAHVTGNFVLIGAGLVEPHQALIGKLLALPVFVLVVATTRLFVLAHEARGRNAVPGVVIGQALFLVLFLLTGIAAGPIGHGDEPAAILAGMMGVTAMAIQNAGSRTVFATLSPTTVMTGNVTQVVIDLVDLAARKISGDQARGRLAKMLPAVIAFAIGAIAGAFGYKLFSFWCLLAPIVTVSAVLVQLLPRAQSAGPA
jgi:uncharacterized membrane protein YoaK (UPF0700 family)